MLSTTDEAALLVLLVEDDVRLAALTCRALQERGFVVDVVHDGRAALANAAASRYDVVLLDLMLPGIDGLEVCRRLRERSTVPIIMLTARDAEADRVLGLELGADDYVCKPFSAPELVARIRALVRRSSDRFGTEALVLSTELGELELDLRALDGTLGGRPLELTAHEFMLLQAMAVRAGRFLSRAQLLELVHRDPGETLDRSVDVLISRIRRKLGDNSRQPRLLKTIRGQGYLFVAERRAR